MRQTASFTLDKDLLDYLSRTRRGRSRSQRVNELLRQAVEIEKERRLEAEAAAFFRTAPPSERAETRAFQRTARKSWDRD